MTLCVKIVSLYTAGFAWLTVPFYVGNHWFA